MNAINGNHLGRCFPRERERNQWQSMAITWGGASHESVNAPHSEEAARGGSGAGGLGLCSRAAVAGSVLPGGAPAPMHRAASNREVVGR